MNELDALIAFYDAAASQAQDAISKQPRTRDGYRRAREARMRMACFSLVAYDLRAVKARVVTE